MTYLDSTGDLLLLRNAVRGSKISGFSPTLMRHVEPDNFFVWASMAVSRLRRETWSLSALVIILNCMLRVGLLSVTPFTQRMMMRNMWALCNMAKPRYKIMPAYVALDCRPRHKKEGLFNSKPMHLLLFQGSLGVWMLWMSSFKTFSLCGMRLPLRGKIKIVLARLLCGLLTIIGSTRTVLPRGLLDSTLMSMNGGATFGRRGKIRSSQDMSLSSPLSLLDHQQLTLLWPRMLWSSNALMISGLRV